MNERSSEQAGDAIRGLLAPLDPQDLPTLLRERVPKLMRGDGHRSLPGWPELREGVASGEIHRDHLRVLRDGIRVSEMFYTDPQGVRLERLEQLLQGGCSLVLQTLDADMEDLRAFADSLRTLLSEYVTVGAVVTTGTRGALVLHYDEEDILAFQVEGTKHWRLHAPTQPNPLKHGPRAPQPVDPPVLEVELHPGDMLFVPAGYWHQCTNRAARSVHYSALIIPLSVTDVLTAVHERLLADPDWRRPFGRSAGIVEDGEGLKSHLAELIGDLDFERLLRERISRKNGKQESAQSSIA